MSRIDEVFHRLRAAKRCALIPFITAGDPNLNTTEQLVRALASSGADIIELGIPYSDPIADGPVIQASYSRALDKGIQLRDIFAAVKDWTSSNNGPLPPLVGMVSYSIVLRHGLQEYVQEAKLAGFEGAIVPDLPVQESGALSAISVACRQWRPSPSMSPSMLMSVSYT